jgi:hypothetical protein
MAFEPIDLSVLVGESGQLWVSASSRLGAVHAVPQRDRVRWSVGELAEHGQLFADAVKHAERDIELAREFGGVLKDLLFGDPEVLALLQRTRGAAADRGDSLLIRVLGAPHEAAALPWELTLDPQGGHEFLALSPDAHICRLARARTYPPRAGGLPEELHLLLVLSSPTISSRQDDSLTFDLYEEKRSMVEALEPLVDAGLMTVDVEDHPTVDNLRRRMTSRPGGYHVVHYLGHALPGVLVLENEAGLERQEDAHNFVNLLTASPQLRLGVYAGCETARSPSHEEQDWRRSLSIADLSVGLAAPAVVGMQAVLPFRTERVFVRSFYRSLAGGRSVADAVRYGRAAVQADEFVGGELLDWAVPTLFLGGVDPGPLLDPGTPPRSVARRRRAESKRNLEEGERSAFARPVALRQAVDVLSGRASETAVTVTGEARARVPFVDRALLAVDADLTLYRRARDLAGLEDPVRSLCELIAELLTDLDGERRRSVPAWTGQDWWDRLIEDLVTCPGVIALDDVDELPSEAVGPVATALEQLSLRRTQTRIMVAGTTMPRALAEGLHRRSTPIVLRPLSFEDVWRWVRRNLPVLARYGTAELQQWYSAGMVDDLETWIDLADRVRATPGRRPSLAPIATRLLEEQPASTVTSGMPPLRAALASPRFAGHEASIAAWITGLATEFHVGGQVLEAAGSHRAGSIAELTSAEGPADSAAEAVDFLLLDSAGGSAEQAEVYVGDAGCLTVGALGRDGRPATSSAWDPGSDRPEIFAPAELDWGPSSALEPPACRGASCAALGVMAAGLLVWSLDRSLTPAAVRDIMLASATTHQITCAGGPHTFRVLDIGAALDRVRSELLLGALDNGPAGHQELLAVTGLPGDVAVPLLDQLAQEKRVRNDVDMELGLVWRDDGDLDISCAYDSPSTNADFRLFGDTPVRIDQEQLEQLWPDEQSYGQLLSDQLFASATVHDFYARARAEAEQEGASLRLRLRLDPDAPPEFHSMRWECLRDPTDRTAIALKPGIIFSRYLAREDWQPIAPPSRHDLRALLVIANPSDLDAFELGGHSLAPVDVAPEQARARKALQGIPVTELASEGSPTLEMICDRLEDGFDILYLVCPTALLEGQALVFLERPDGTAAPITGAELGSRLSSLERRPTLTVLSSTASSTLGPKLAASGMAAVLTMQESLSAPTADVFVPSFFQSFLVDGVVDRAVAAARREVRDRPDWWVPVLSLRLRSSRTFYLPQFANRVDSTWRGLVQQINDQWCTPVVGPGLAESVLGSRMQMAQRWAARWLLPIALTGRDDLTKVAQYVRVNAKLGPALQRYLVDELREQHQDDLPPDALESGDARMVIDAIGARRRQRDPSDPYNILASLGLPIYVTTDFTGLLEAALVEAGRAPDVRVFDWRGPAAGAEGTVAEPTADRPLVYHLFGHLDQPESVVLAEDDHLEWLAAWLLNLGDIPSCVRHALTRRSLMFLGYALGDLDFRVLFQSLKSVDSPEVMRDNMHVGVQLNPESSIVEPEAAQEYLESYFGQYQFNLYWGTATEFMRDLEARLHAA